MTGQGEASRECAGAYIAVEIRAVNNRHLKLVSRLSESIASLEPSLETLVRQKVRRGSLQLNVRVKLPARSEDFKLNTVALASYAKQAIGVAQQLGINPNVDMGYFVMLPGVVESPERLGDADQDLLDAARNAIEIAIENLNRMRLVEGQAMGQELLAGLARIDALSGQVLERAPVVVSDYKLKMENKIRQSLADLKTNSEPSDLIREVLLFADRSDIREELVRLNSHVQQFRDAIAEEESQGRKLDFLIQELFRETNTVGSKANDATISKCIVEIKTIIEQMRELVQNLE